MYQNWYQWQGGTNNYILQILWDVITYPWAWYLLMAHKSQISNGQSRTNCQYSYEEWCVRWAGTNDYIPQYLTLFIWQQNWWVLCQKQASRAGTSNYIPQYMCHVITCPCPWHLLLEQHSLYLPKQDHCIDIDYTSVRHFRVHRCLTHVDLRGFATWDVKKKYDEWIWN